VHQPEEEVGSAGEQPASNKVDGYTIKGGYLPPFLLVSFWLR